MEAEREQARLDAVSAGSDKMIETLSRIAENSDDPQVAMEALRRWPNCARRTWTPRRTPTETTKVQRTVHILRLTWRDMGLLQAYIDAWSSGNAEAIAELITTTSSSTRTSVA